MSAINGLRHLVSQQPRLPFAGGLALAMDSPRIPAVQAAVTVLMADATYARILATSALRTSQVDPPEPA